MLWGDIGMRVSASAHRKGELGELERLAAEQAALGRVAELVARQTPVQEVFALVTEELSRLLDINMGLHPAVLSEDGLRPALLSLALRSAVPTELDLDLGPERLEEPLEVAVYYVASEALTNTAKHAHASRAQVKASQYDGWLELIVGDDGQRGADASGGSGLTGLVDRVEAIGGTIHIKSRADVGTAIHVRLPTGSR